MTPLLEARRVRKVFPTGGGLFGRRTQTVAVDGFSLRISAAEPSFTTIAGESGSGKTTIARLLLGFAEPTEGAVLYEGRELARLAGAERRRFRQQVQAIFQDPFEVYNPFYKVDHILTTPIARFALAASRAQAEEMIVGALEAVGLHPGETLGRYPHQLSGGQRQRITIARALLLKPKLIIADEPVSMVDASLRATILGNLHALHRDFGISFVYITHDLTTAYQVSRHIVVLYHGCVAEAGDVEQVIRDPLHPYTRELVRSIPVPDPGSAWIDSPVEDSREEDAVGGAGPPVGCPYAPRCPHATPRCFEGRPGLYHAARGRAVACYLYEGSPALANEDLAPLLG
ncbi:MAG: ABC transporter ATP-binding protein [Candidatus Latescibacterota bacterium]